MPELNRWVIANIETGRRDSVSVDELYVLARALGVAPTHLLVPIDEQPVCVTPAERPVGSRTVREWVIGEQMIRGSGTGTGATYWHEAPDGWRDRQPRRLVMRLIKAVWLAFHDATNPADGTVDAAELERQLESVLEDDSWAR